MGRQKVRPPVEDELAEKTLQARQTLKDLNAARQLAQQTLSEAMVRINQVAEETLREIRKEAHETLTAVRGLVQDATRSRKEIEEQFADRLVDRIRATALTISEDSIKATAHAAKVLISDEVSRTGNRNAEPL